MELAVVIGVLALVVSIGSVLFTKRSADETSALRTIESQRWQAERCPVLGVVIAEMNQGQCPRPWVTLESSEPLDSIRANILDNPEVWFADGQTGVQPGVGRTHEAAWGRLPFGKREAAWRPDFGDTPDSIRLLLTR